jgi:hypothetical protein
MWVVKLLFKHKLMVHSSMELKRLLGRGSDINEILFSSSFAPTHTTRIN